MRRERPRNPKPSKIRIQTRTADIQVDTDGQTSVFTNDNGNVDTVNHCSGSATNVIQTRDFHGSVTFS